MKVYPRRAQRFVRLGLGAIFFLSSCSILPEPETLDVYHLPSTSVPTTAQVDKLPWLLRITTPHSNRLTDAERVLMLREDSRISTYKGARWSDPPSVLLRNRFTNAFRSDGRLSTISVDNPNLLADLELDGDLSAFQVEYTHGTPAAVIRFYAALVQPARNRVIAERSFEISQPVEGAGMPEVIRAFGRSADNLAGEIIDWTVEQGTAQLSAQQSAVHR